MNNKQGTKDTTKLSGGREGQIFTNGKTVLRPAKSWSKNVHNFLEYLHKQGISFVPKPLGIRKDGQEEVSYIEGEVHNYPLCENAYSINALVSSAKMLRRYHDAGRGYIDRLDGNELWMLKPKTPIETICHGDYAPYNVVLNKDHAIGIIDFDTIHPGPIVWDIVYALYRWAPIKNPYNPDSLGDLNTQIKRARIFCDAYGLDIENRKLLTTIMIERLQALVDFMFQESRLGNDDFTRNIEDDHHLLYLKDIEYIRTNEEKISMEMLLL